MTAYYNDNNPAAAAWLRWLIAEGLIAPGEVDERSIEDVQPDEIRRFTQCHFCAGIGGWPLAARMAGWDDTRPLWSASLPCQPFSQIGAGLGTDDSRHLWPDLYRLVDPARPAVIVGEQVAGEAGFDWFDRVCADLEASGYACRSIDIPACAVNSPQQRNRQYWLALGGPVRARLEGLGGDDARARGRQDPDRSAPAPDDRDRSFWADAEWITCHDGERRRISPARPPLLAYGVPRDVVAWSGLGNAVVPPLAREVIAALIDILD